MIMICVGGRDVKGDETIIGFSSHPTHLDVDVCAVPHEQLEAEGAVARGGGEVQRGEALLVHLVDVGARLDELVHHHVLPVVASHVQRCVSVCVRLVYLQMCGRGQERE